MTLIDQFSNYQQGRGFSPKTVARRRTSVEGFRHFILPAHLDQVGGADVEEWLLSKPTVKTRHAYRSDLNCFYKWAIRRAGFTINPILDTDPIKVPKARPHHVGQAVASFGFTATVAGRPRVLGAATASFGFTAAVTIIAYRIALVRAGGDRYSAVAGAARHSATAGGRYSATAGTQRHTADPGAGRYTSED